MSDQVEISVGEKEDESWVIDSICNFRLQSVPISVLRINRIPTMVKDNSEEHYQKYYVPKVVSIGPYHHGNPKLDSIEKLKPNFTMSLLDGDKEKVRRLYRHFGEANKVQELRSFYEENSTAAFSNKVFVKMMLLDACFILYYIRHFFAGERSEQYCSDITNHQIVFIRHDLFLLENQIPFQVLDEVLKLLNIDSRMRIIKDFIFDNILAYASYRSRRRKRWYEKICICSRHWRERRQEFFDAGAPPVHFLHLVHLSLTKGKCTFPDVYECYGFTFRHVSDLTDVGIQFKPGRFLGDVDFLRTWWFSATVKLPAIVVNDSTKPLLLNLMAYEMCFYDERNSWVTAYICLLNSLIDQPEDVKTLRKAGVLEISLGSDKDVVKLFKEIGADVVANNNFAYLEAKYKIQKHYQSWRNGCFSQLKQEYFKSPWAFIAVVGATMALFLSSVQTYFTVWSPKGA